jgi:hypothetical protein
MLFDECVLALKPQKMHTKDISLFTLLFITD